MRALSKQRLSKMHAMLDKELQNEQQTLSNHSSMSQNRKERGNFSHLRYTSNINLDDKLEQNTKQSVNQRPRDVSSEKQSLFRKSLEKNVKTKLQLSKQSRKQYGASSSSSSSLEKQSKSSMRGSRKNEIDQLQKKLLDLEKKMENVNLTSSQDDDEQPSVKIQQKYIPKTSIQTLNKNDSKKSLNILKLQQNGIQSPKQTQEINNTNEGTARFNGNNRNDEGSKKDKNDFKSNLPLSHRKNTVSDKEDSSNSDENQYEMKYNKFVKVTREIKNPVHKSRQPKKSDSSEEEDSSDGKHQGSGLTKSISQQIERLSIMNKESKVVTNLKQNLSKNKLSENYQQKNNSKQHHVKINTIPVQPERKMTVQHEILQPKYQPQMNKNKSKSRQKKSIKMPKNALSKEKVLSVKKSNRSEREQSSSKKIQRNHTNLDNSFRSENSAKSKKSMKSLRSVGSNKSLSRRQGGDLLKVQNIEQRKYIKRIQNLQKELEHYKRLSKRYQNQVSDYKLMQIQYKKMDSQFRKSEHIRIQQKKIIENFKQKAINNG